MELNFFALLFLIVAVFYSETDKIRFLALFFLGIPRYSDNIIGQVIIIFTVIFLEEENINEPIRGTEMEKTNSFWGVQ